MNDLLEKEIEQISILIDKLKELNNERVKLQFVTVKELAEAGHMSMATAHKIFDRPDFPSCNFGKEKIAEIHAVINYFSVKREK